MAWSKVHSGLRTHTPKHTHMLEGGQREDSKTTFFNKKSKNSFKGFFKFISQEKEFFHDELSCFKTVWLSPKFPNGLRPAKSYMSGAAAQTA